MSVITYKPGQCPNMKCPHRDAGHSHPRFNELGWDMASPLWWLPPDRRSRLEVAIADGDWDAALALRKTAE